MVGRFGFSFDSKILAAWRHAEDIWQNGISERFFPLEEKTIIAELFSSTSFRSYVDVVRTFS